MSPVAGRSVRAAVRAGQIRIGGSGLWVTGAVESWPVRLGRRGSGPPGWGAAWPPGWGAAWPPGSAALGSTGGGLMVLRDRLLRPAPTVVLRDKLREWGGRYLLAELVGTVAAVTAALAVYAGTGSLASAALAGSLAETVGFYAVILRRILPELYRRHAGTGPVRRLLRTVRSAVGEASDFLAAEIADTALVRPGLIYLAASWTGSGVGWGLLIGKLLADVGFYAVVIPSYEVRKRLMHG